MKLLNAIAAAVVSALFGAGCDVADRPEVAAPAAGDTADRGTAAEQHEHANHAAAPDLPAGQLWATDVPLRSAMTRIRSAVEQSWSAYERGSLQAESAAALAAAVEADVRYMVENCKLEPEPDAALHALIGRLLSAAGVVRADPGSPDGVPQLAAVLHDYGVTFDHPGWTDAVAPATPAGAKAIPLLARPLGGIEGMEGLLLAVEYPPGGSSPGHRHNANTFVYVLEGSIVMQVAGGNEVTLKPGETFYERPADVHTVSRNASSIQPAKFLVFMVKAVGAPVSESVK